MCCQGHRRCNSPRPMSQFCCFSSFHMRFNLFLPKINHRRPDIVIHEQKGKENYQDLAREIKRIWKSRTKVVPVVVGALGSVSKKLAGHLEQLEIKNRTRTMRKSALLGSASTLRKVLEVWCLGVRLDWIFLPRENPWAKFYIIIVPSFPLTLVSVFTWSHFLMAGIGDLCKAQFSVHMSTCGI